MALVLEVVDWLCTRLAADDNELGEATPETRELMAATVSIPLEAIGLVLLRYTYMPLHHTLLRSSVSPDRPGCRLVQWFVVGCRILDFTSTKLWISCDRFILRNPSQNVIVVFLQSHFPCWIQEFQ